jgi:hypothetical protein
MHDRLDSTTESPDARRRGLRVHRFRGGWIGQGSEHPGILGHEPLLRFAERLGPNRVEQPERGGAGR